MKPGLLQRGGNLAAVGKYTQGGGGSTLVEKSDMESDDNLQFSRGAV